MAASVLEYSLLMAVTNINLYLLLYIAFIIVELSIIINILRNKKKYLI